MFFPTRCLISPRPQTKDRGCALRDYCAVIVGFLYASTPRGRDVLRFIRRAGSAEVALCWLPRPSQNLATSFVYARIPLISTRHTTHHSQMLTKKSDIAPMGRVSVFRTFRSRGGTRFDMDKRPLLNPRHRCLTRPSPDTDSYPLGPQRSVLP